MDKKLVRLKLRHSDTFVTDQYYSVMIIKSSFQQATIRHAYDKSREMRKLTTLRLVPSRTDNPRMAAFRQVIRLTKWEEA